MSLESALQKLQAGSGEETGGFAPIPFNESGYADYAKGIAKAGLDIGGQIPGMGLAFGASGLASLLGPVIGGMMGADPATTRAATEDFQELMSGALAQPFTPAGEKFAETIGTLFKPVEAVGHFTDEQLSKLDPRLGLIGGFVSELAVLGALGLGGRRVFRKYKSIKEAADAGNKADTVKAIDEFFEDLDLSEEAIGEFKSLRTPQEKQNWMNRWTKGTGEQRQAEIEAFEGRARPEPMAEEPGVYEPFRRVIEEQKEGARAEGASHAQKIQSALERLKTEEVPKDARRAGEKIEEAGEPVGEVREAEAAEGGEPIAGERPVRVRDAAEDGVNPKVVEKAKSIAEGIEDAEFRKAGYGWYSFDVDVGGRGRASFQLEAKDVTPENISRKVQEVKKRFEEAPPVDEGLTEAHFEPFFDEKGNVKVRASEAIRKMDKKVRTGELQEKLLKIEKDVHDHGYDILLNDEGTHVVVENVVGKEGKGIGKNRYLMRKLDNVLQVIAESGKDLKTSPLNDWVSDMLYELGGTKEAGDIRVPNSALKEYMASGDTPAKRLRAFKGIEEKPVEAPKVEEPTVPEFTKAEFVEEEGIQTNFDYDLWGGKEFDTFAEAEAYRTGPRAKGKRRKLQEGRGSDLEIIKVGDKYRVAEPLAMTDKEALMIDEGIKKYHTERRSRIEEAVGEFDEGTISNQLEGLYERLGAWEKGEPVDIELIADNLQVVTDNAEMAKHYELAERGSKMLEWLRKRKDFLDKQVKPTENPGMTEGKHPWQRWNPETGEKSKAGLLVDIVLDGNGRPFVDPQSALKVLKENNIEGIVEFVPKLDGFVIEKIKPESIEPKPEVGTARKIKEVSPEYAAREARIFEFRKILKEVIDSIKDTLDERGSISFRDLDPAKRERLRRLVTMAAQAGDSVYEHVMKIGGYTEKQARAAQKMADEMSQSMKMGETSFGLEEFETGEVVNSGKMERTVGTEVIKRPKIYAGVLDALKRLAEPKRSLRATRITREFVPTEFMIDEIEGHLPLEQQGLGRAFRENYWEREGMIKDGAEGVVKQRLELSKGLNRRSGRRIGTYAMWEQKDIRARMERDGWKVEDIPELTPQEMKVYEFMRRILDARGPIINQMRKLNNLAPMKLLENYFTVMYSETLAQKLGLGPNTVFDKPHIVEGRYVNFKEKPFKFSRRRSKEGLKKEMKLNAFEIFDQYIFDSFRHEHMTPFIAKLYELGKPLKDGFDAEGKQKYYRLDKDKPELATWFRRWANQLAGRDVENPLNLGSKAMESWLKKRSRNVSVSILGFLLRSPFVQLSALRGSPRYNGWIHTLQGITDMMNPGEAKRAIRESRVLKLRKQEFLGRAISREGFTDKSLWMLKKFDQAPAIATWLASERFAKSQGITDPKVIRRYADSVVAKTQGTALTGDIPPIQRAALGRAIFTLQTFTINDWNFMYKDVFGAGKGKKMSPKQRARAVFDVMVATALVNVFFEDLLGTSSPFPTPIRTMIDAINDGEKISAVVRKTLGELLEPVPGIGGKARYNVALGGAVYETLDKLATSLLTDPLDRDLYDKVGPAWEYGMKYLGIPGAQQLGKSRRAIKRGETNPYYILIGKKYEPKSKGLTGLPGLEGLEGL